MLFLTLNVSNAESHDLLAAAKAMQDAAGEVITSSSAKVSRYASGSAEMRQAVEEEEYATRLFAVTGRLIHALQQHHAELNKPVHRKMGEVIRSPRRANG